MPKTQRSQPASNKNTATAANPGKQPYSGEPLWRRENVGRLLNDAVARFENSILKQMEQAGYKGFSLSHISVTRNLDLEGTRATELARRAGITKQSMSELIQQLESNGIVERRPDPADGRAKIVFFSKAGLTWLEAFRASLHNAETCMIHELGQETVSALKHALATYAYEQSTKQP